MKIMGSPAWTGGTITATGKALWLEGQGKRSGKGKEGADSTLSLARRTADEERLGGRGAFPGPFTRQVIMTEEWYFTKVLVLFTSIEQVRRQDERDESQPRPHPCPGRGDGRCERQSHEALW